jgi:Nucleotidyl transferase AbiEii toxin, Type IV TA system
MVSDPVVQALQHVWTALLTLKRPMALMGGIALSFWKHPRFTQDVDLLVEVEDADVAKIVNSLTVAEIRPKRQPPLLTLGPHRLVQFLYEPPGSFFCLQIDLLLAQSKYQKLCLQRRIPARLPGANLEIAVLSCEDLILHKLMAGRVIDRVDVAFLIRANQSSLDIQYLLSWSNSLNLRSELQEIWPEGFPGDTLPTTQ